MDDDLWVVVMWVMGICLIAIWSGLCEVGSLEVGLIAFDRELFVLLAMGISKRHVFVDKFCICP